MLPPLFSESLPELLSSTFTNEFTSFTKSIDCISVIKFGTYISISTSTFASIDGTSNDTDLSSFTVEAVATPLTFTLVFLIDVNPRPLYLNVIVIFPSFTVTSVFSSINCLAILCCDVPSLLTALFNV